MTKKDSVWILCLLVFTTPGEDVIAQYDKISDGYLLNSIIWNRRYVPPLSLRLSLTNVHLFLNEFLNLQNSQLYMRIRWIASLPKRPISDRRIGTKKLGLLLSGNYICPVRFLPQLLKPPFNSPSTCSSSSLLLGLLTTTTPSPS